MSNISIKLICFLICTGSVIFSQKPEISSPSDAEISSHKVKTLLEEIFTSRYQTTLPGRDNTIKTEKIDGRSPQTITPPSDLFSPASTRKSNVTHHSNASVYFFKIIIYACSTLVIVWLVIFIFSKFPRNSSSPPTLKKTLTAGDDSPAIDPLHADAESLAKAGRFSEAVHRILLLSIQWLTDYQKIKIHSSQTSREFLDNIKQDNSLYKPLHTLILMVERSYFGTKLCSELDYTMSLTLYRQITDREGTA